MKPLILILLAAVCAQAQSIAEVARRERARQAQVKTTKIFTSADLKNLGARDTAEVSPVENPAPEPPPAAATPAADPAQASRLLDVDYAQQWTQETAKLRALVRDLIDQETATQLEINSASSQINAPITTQSAKDQAARNLDAAQQRLVTIRADLAKARSELQEKDLQWPAR